MSEFSEHGETIEPEESDTPCTIRHKDDDSDSEGEERLLNRHWYACASYKNAHKQACNLFRCHGVWKLCYNANGMESVVEENHTDISCYE